MKHNKGQVCAELQAQLPDYLDGEAKEAICRAIEEHLASCEDCRVVVDTMKKTIALYRAAPRAQVPTEIHHRLVRVLHLDDLPPHPDK
jgi:predicted anti-sigma-YlaC factor YlaD